MYSLLVKLFLRQRITVWTFALLLLLGLSAIGVGRQFLNQQARNIVDIHTTQEHHISSNVKNHPDDIGLLLYYLKFAYINPVSPLAGVAIGQTDLNNNIEHVTILALEGQKYDTDLISPSKLQVGNLDLSFVLIFLFPLVIIALTFNLWYEEVEKGTWRMIKIQGRSVFRFLMAKLLIRLALVLSALLLLYAVAIVVLGIPLDARLGMTVLLGVLYVFFWFGLSLFVVSLKRSSSINAVVLLSLWLSLVILLPAGLNSYVMSKYPLDEAMSLTLKQRDEYHKRWDTDKQETMRKFNECYPQFAEYSVPDSGFTWHWYYAMQHMGDLESREERGAMLAQVRERERLSNSIADFFPPIKIQLSLNELARTDLSSYLDYLDATTEFHECRRLEFYPHIIHQSPASAVDWSQYKPETYERERAYDAWGMLAGTVICTLLLLLLAIYRLRRF